MLTETNSYTDRTRDKQGLIVFIFLIGKLPIPSQSPHLSPTSDPCPNPILNQTTSITTDSTRQSSLRRQHPSKWKMGGTGGGGGKGARGNGREGGGGGRSARLPPIKDHFRSRVESVKIFPRRGTENRRHVGCSSSRARCCRVGTAPITMS